MPRGDTRVDGAAEGGVETAASESRLGECGPHGMLSEACDVLVGETAERVDADAGDVDRPPRAHHRSVRGA